MIAVVTASAVTAYALYTMSPETVAKFHTQLLPATLPFVLYGIFRYLYLLYRRQLGGNPSELFLNDRALLINTPLLDGRRRRHHLLVMGGLDRAPQAPRARRRPGVAVAPLDLARRFGGPARRDGAARIGRRVEGPPKAPALVARPGNPGRSSAWRECKGLVRGPGAAVRSSGAARNGEVWRGPCGPLHVRAAVHSIG